MPFFQGAKVASESDALVSVAMDTNQLAGWSVLSISSSCPIPPLEREEEEEEEEEEKVCKRVRYTQATRRGRKKGGRDRVTKKI